MKGKLRLLDLFSGIGGFTLGLDSTGYFETVAFCEIEAFPCKILNKHWPNVPIYNDVRELSYEKLEADGIVSDGRRIDVICGGYPCQPFSVAGHQKGEADKRHLWPEYFRLVRELRPHYAIGENVGGHLRLGLDSVLEDLDSEDYTVRCFSVEAASLGAPHRRERIFWIAECRDVAESKRHGCIRSEKSRSYKETIRQKQEGEENTLNSKRTSSLSRTEPHVADTASEGKWEEADQLRSQEESLSDKRRTRLWGGSDSSGSNAADTHREGLERRARNTGEEEREVLPGIEHDRDEVRGTPGCSGGKGSDDANTETKGLEGRDLGTAVENKGSELGDIASESHDRAGTDGADTDIKGLEGSEESGNTEEERKEAEQLVARQGAQRSEEERNQIAFESYLGGGTDGLSSWMDGTWERGIPRVAPTDKARVPRLKALGNAVVPQLVYWVGMAVVLSTMREKEGDENGR